jgi:hypothetical protein
MSFIVDFSIFPIGKEESVSNGGNLYLSHLST